MMRYYIDFSGAVSREQLHDALEKALPLPDYYGRNLDAFYDILTSLPESFRNNTGEISEDHDPGYIFVFSGWKDAENGGDGDYFRRFRRMCSRIEREEENLLFLWKLV